MISAHRYKKELEFKRKYFVFMDIKVTGYFQPIKKLQDNNLP
jgi:hypothetical protein